MVRIWDVARAVSRSCGRIRFVARVKDVAWAVSWSCSRIRDVARAVTWPCSGGRDIPRAVTWSCGRFVVRAGTLQELLRGPVTGL